MCTLLFYGIFAFLFLVTSPEPSSATAENKLPTISIGREAAFCLKTADWQCAVEMLVPEHERRGDYSGIQYYIAHALRQLGRNAFADADLARAEQLFEQAIEYDSSDPSLYAELGRIYLEQSRYDDAVRTFNRAYEIDNSNPRYAETLAQIHYLSGSLEDAIDFLEQAIALEPERKDLRRRLSQLRQKLQTEINGTVQVSQVFRLNVEEGIDNDLLTDIWDMLENAWYKLGLELDFYPKRQISVYMLSTDKFQSFAGVPVWSGGIYEGRISLPVRSDQPEQMAEIITHEYTHALLYDAMAYRCPWWLNEGLAQYFSLSRQKRLQTILAAIRGHKKSDGWSRTAPRLAELDKTLKSQKQAIVSYGLALSATEFLIERYTVVTLRAILHSMAEGKNFEEALQEHAAITFDEFQDSWWRQL